MESEAGRGECNPQLHSSDAVLVVERDVLSLLATGRDALFEGRVVAQREHGGDPVLPRHRNSGEGTVAGRGGIPKTPGSATFPFRKGAASSGRGCFADRIGRTAPGNRPTAREPGRSSRT